MPGNSLSPENSPLRVLHLLETDQFAGTEAHVLSLMRSLNERGVETCLVARTGTPLLRRAREASLRCNDHSSLQQVAHLIRREGFTVIHAHDGASKFKALAAVTLARTDVRALATQHFVHPAYTQRTGWKRVLGTALHRLANRRLAASIAVSEAVREAALKRGEVDPNQFFVVPNGMTLFSSVTPSEVAAAREALGIPPAELLICTVARLAREKGIKHLLRAIPQVLQIYPSARFLLVGDGPEREELQEEASRMGLDSTVIFAGFRTDVPVLIAAADLFVLPSLEEPFGIALLEAMALARPVVATRAGGPQEIVGDGETGLLVPPADSPALAAAILSLLGDPLRAARMGQEGLNRQKTHFSAAIMAQRTETVYTSVLLKSRGGRRQT